MVKFSEVKQSNEILGDLRTCAVCLEDYKDEEDVYVTLCKRIIHTGCQSSWSASAAGYICMFCKQREIAKLTPEDLAKTKYFYAVIDPDTGEVDDYCGNVQRFANDLNSNIEQLSLEQCYDIAEILCKYIHRRTIFDECAHTIIVVGFMREINEYFAVQNIDSNPQLVQAVRQTVIDSLRDPLAEMKKILDDQYNPAESILGAIKVISSIAILVGVINTIPQLAFSAYASGKALYAYLPLKC